MTMFSNKSETINLMNSFPNKVVTILLQNVEGSGIEVKYEFQKLLVFDAVFVVNIVAAIPSIRSIACFAR